MRSSFFSVQFNISKQRRMTEDVVSLHCSLPAKLSGIFVLCRWQRWNAVLCNRRCPFSVDAVLWAVMLYDGRSVIRSGDKRHWLLQLTGTLTSDRSSTVRGIELSFTRWATKSGVASGAAIRFSAAISVASIFYRHQPTQRVSHERAISGALRAVLDVEEWNQSTDQPVSTQQLVNSQGTNLHAFQLSAGDSQLPVVRSFGRVVPSSM